MEETTETAVELAELRSRVAELERRNRELAAIAQKSAAAAKTRPGWRAVLASVLIVVSVLLAPIAVLGSWARTQLVDTDRFVQTFAPLAQQPDVQTLVINQVVQAIEDSIDIDELVGGVFVSLEELDLSPQARAAIPLLEGPTAEGIRALTRSGVERLVTSSQFAQLWEGALRATHSRTIAVIQGDPNRALQLFDDGTLTLELSAIIQAVKQVLIDQELRFAERIPEVHRSIPILASDSLVTVRTVYQIAVVAGYWLPWAVLALLAVGIGIARDRARALAWAGAGLAVSLLLLAGGIGIGGRVFTGAVSPSIMPAATSQAVFSQLTELLSSALLALVVLSLFLAMGGWLSSSSRTARSLQRAASSGFTALRQSADRRGLGTGSFGRAVEKLRPGLVAGTVGACVLALFLNRPVSVGGVTTTLLVVIAVLLIIELVRRPVDPVIGTESGEVDAVESAGST